MTANSDQPQSEAASVKKPRQMTIKRRLAYFFLEPLVVLIVRIVWISCRVKIIGQQNMDRVLKQGSPVIPCYWHQQHLFCSWYMLQQIAAGMKVGFLISPSVDGEIPAKIVSSRGARVIRGSSNRTGAKSIRDIYMLIAKEGVSPVIISDGPTGPIFRFKQGAVMVARLTKTPMLPIACAASSAWYLGSWDRFMIPRPFSTVIIAVGEPVVVQAGKVNEDLQPYQDRMENAVNKLMALAAAER